MRRFVCTFLTTIFLFAGMSLAPGQAKADASLDVWLIHAKAGPAEVDPDLKELKNYFGRFPMFTFFKQLSVKKLKLPLDGKGSVSMPNGKKLTLTFRGMSEKYVKLRFELADMKMNIRITNGGIFFHGGLKYEGGRLIFAIQARGK